MARFGWGAWGPLLRWQDGALLRFTNSAPWEAVPAKAGFDLNAHPLLEDSTGQLWFGARDRGLFTLASNQVVHVRAADDGRTNWTVHVLHEDRAGRLWIGSDVGLLEKQAEHFLRYTTRDGLLDNDILGIRDAPDGSLWVGTAKGLDCFRDGRFHALTARDGLLSDQANPLLVEEDGTVWVGTPLGLNRIRGGEIRAVTERQGLLDNALFCLLDDRAGHYWASSVRGIFRMRKADLHALADGRQGRLYCVSYGEADGAASAEGVGGYQPSACRTPDGRIWFPTTRGVVVLDPAALVEREVPPPVVIEEVLANDQLVFADRGPTALGAQMRETASGIRVPAGRADVLEIRYTANSFVAPEKVQFRYRLEGADAQWRSAGTRRVAFYTNLRPQAYRFRVEASNREGTWSEHPAVFAFSIAPHFWETWLFYASCVVVVLVAGGVMQAYRLRWQGRLLKVEHQQALADERTRIARDLHDDLGAQPDRHCARTGGGPPARPGRGRATRHAGR
jgi:ligand-binding sensor domain-containing protein